MPDLRTVTTLADFNAIEVIENCNKALKIVGNRKGAAQLASQRTWKLTLFRPGVDAAKHTGNFISSCLVKRVPEVDLSWGTTIGREIGKVIQRGGK